MPSILIVGAGAIGAFFGAALARQGAAVSVVCRSDREAVARHGFDIRSPLLGDHRFRPSQVLGDTSAVGATPDYLVLTTKVHREIDRVALIRSAVGEHTKIVLIQNGIDIEAELAAAFPGNELISGIAFIAVARTGPGEIHHQSAGTLTFGCYPAGLSAATRSLAALFEASGVKCRLTEDVVGARWDKALWNAAFNPLSVLGGVFDTSVMLAGTEERAFIRTIMGEIAAVAAASGHAIKPGLIDTLIERTSAMPPFKTSMAQDFENGRPMEIEAILGNVVRAARRYAVATPALETIYSIVKMAETRAARHEAKRE